MICDKCIAADAKAAEGFRNPTVTFHQLLESLHILRSNSKNQLIGDQIQDRQGVPLQRISATFANSKGGVLSEPGPPEAEVELRKFEVSAYGLRLCLHLHLRFRTASQRHCALSILVRREKSGGRVQAVQEV
jgi:hypothetical protein